VLGVLSDLGPHDETEGVGELRELLEREVLGEGGCGGEGLGGALEEERDAMLVLLAAYINYGM